VSLLKRVLSWLSGRRTKQLQDTGDIVWLMFSSWVAQAVYVATQLGIPDHLATASKSPKELAELTASRQPQIEQLMRALAGFGVFAADEDGKYRNTVVSQQLRAAESPWLRSYVLLWGEQLYPAGQHILEMVTSGRVAFECEFGKPLYDHYRSCPHANDRFVDHMHSTTQWQREIIAKDFEFDKYHHVVDVGGGRAGMLTAILQACPHIQGTILDQPHMADLVNQQIREANIADRCTFVGGSFLEAIPAGGDLYMIKHVLHDWADQHVDTILRNVATVMPREGLLIIAEALLDDRNGVDQFAKMRDLEQMLWTGGRVRSRREFEILLDRAGLRLLRVHQTAIIDTCLIMAQRKQ